MGNPSRFQIGFIFMVLLLGLNIIFIIRNLGISEPPEFNKKIYTLKPILSGEITTNPDFVYDNSGWFIKGWDPELERLVVDWESDGWYENGTVDSRSNIIVLHPYDVEKGRYIQRTVYLPKGSYELVVGLANVAGKMPDAKPAGCNDVGFLIKIIDLRGKEWIISDEVIDSGDGWVNLSFDITDFAKKTITIRVESYAGGPCGNWRAEWAAVDYIDIIETST